MTNLSETDLELIIDSLDYRADCIKRSIIRYRKNGEMDIVPGLEIEWLKLQRIIRKLNKQLQA